MTEITFLASSKSFKYQMKLKNIIIERGNIAKSFDILRFKTMNCKLNRKRIMDCQES
jgi:hypothetical protein